MISIKLCNQVEREDVYEAFKYGFSDYPVPMTLSLDEFFVRFFGAEGNDVSTSFIAFDDEKAIGVVFGGARMFDNAKTMRCGALCIGTEYRGKKIANMLMRKHIEKAKEIGCNQLFLEVMSKNERAIAFYERVGYFRVHNLKYFYLAINEELLRVDSKHTIENSDFNSIELYRNKFKDIHINWQNEVDYFREANGHVYLRAMLNDDEVGYIVMSKAGKLEQLYVCPEYRRKGIGRELLFSAALKQNVAKIHMCISSNSQYECFARKLLFKKEDLEQLEMYLPL